MQNWTLLFWILLGVHALIALRWVRGWLDVRRINLDSLELLACPDRQAAPGDPSLTIVIAAHNEADNIEACLTRLASQNYPFEQIIVANDRSTDGTGAIVARIAKRDPRIVLVNVDHLPDGWIGKCHALAQGARQATGDDLLFLDSDVYLHAGALAAVMDKVKRDGVEFLTFWPWLGLKRFADRLLVPPVGWVLSVWTWQRMGSISTVEPPIMGNGQFLLISRAAYEKIGGHTAVAAELAEDAVMAENAYRAGLRRWVGLGKKIYLTSRDSSFRRCLDGLARTVIGSLGSLWKLHASQHLLLGGCILPYWVAPLCAVLLGRGVAPLLTSVWIGVCAVHVIAMNLTLRKLFALTMADRINLALYPIGCVVTVWLLTRCIFIMTGRGVLRWGATLYRVRGSRIVRAIS